MCGYFGGISSNDGHSLLSLYCFFSWPYVVFIINYFSIFVYLIVCVVVVGSFGFFPMLCVYTRRCLNEWIFLMAWQSGKNLRWLFFIQHQKKTCLTVRYFHSLSLFRIDHHHQNIDNDDDYNHEKTMNVLWVKKQPNIDLDDERWKKMDGGDHDNNDGGALSLSHFLEFFFLSW